MRARYGDLLRVMGRLGDAERELRRASAEGGQDDVLPMAALADVLVARGELGEAETLLGPVLAREPRNPMALVARGRLRLARNEPNEAASDFQAAADGGDNEALLELSELHARMGASEAQAEAAERVLAHTPAHPWALALLGHARILEGRRDEGEALLQKSLRAGPRRAVVWRRLAAAFEAAGRADLARRCRNAAAGDPRSAAPSGH